MKLTNVSSSTSAYILQALLAAQEKDNQEIDDFQYNEDKYYDLNSADIIKEEEFEESIGNELSNRKNSSRLGLNLKL